MKRDTLETPDGIQLTYFDTGNNDTRANTMVMVNAPGMSSKFWLPMLGILATRYRIVGMEYRGFPGGDVELSESQCSIASYVDDLELVLKATGTTQATLVSWCLGGKVMLEYYRRHPHAVRAMVGLNIFYREIRDEARGPFSSLIKAFKERLERDPSAIGNIINLMKNIGTVPNLDFVHSVSSEDEESPALALYDFLDHESSFSNLAYYLIDNPVGLRNYLKLTKSTVLRQMTIIRCLNDYQQRLVLSVADVPNT